MDAGQESFQGGRFANHTGGAGLQEPQGFRLGERGAPDDGSRGRTKGLKALQGIHDGVDTEGLVEHQEGWLEFADRVHAIHQRAFAGNHPEFTHRFQQGTETSMAIGSVSHTATLSTVLPSLGGARLRLPMILIGPSEYF